VTKRFDRASRGCERGRGTDCVALGDLFFGDAAEPALEPAGAQSAYERACDLGDRIGCERLQERFPAPPTPHS